MATIGQPLTEPEAGWTRIDNTDNRINYIGSGWNRDINGDTTAFYHGDCAYTNIPSDSLTFKFYGTKLRIITQPYVSRSNKLVISIDNLSETYSIYDSSAVTAQRLNYEKTGLDLSIHTVTVTNQSTNNGTFVWDALDIDNTGYLLAPILVNLTASAGDSQIILNWEAVADATSYNVKRSITAGGPYTTIASNVSGTNYVDFDVINGTIYYYVVSAITAGEESDNSNEALAAPVEEVEAILRVTMIDSSEREYKLPMNEINGFISWFDREIGTGTTVYVLNKVLTNSKEYLAFDKIISFEVVPVAE